MEKLQLVFTGVSDTESDNVGAWLRDSAGNGLTSTLLSGKQALDVNIANTTPISVTSATDTSPATQNITAQDVASVSTPQANAQNAITGTPTAGSAATFTLASNATVEVQVSGTWTGTLAIESSMDGGTTYYANGIKQSGASYFASSFTSNFEGVNSVSAFTHYRIRATAAWTGTATVKVVISNNLKSIVVSNPLTLRDSVVQSIANTIKAASTAALATDTALVVALSPNSPLPTGANVIGAVTQSGGPWTQNLTQVGGAAISLGTKTSANSLPVVLASDQAAIPVTQSGTWTVQQGTPPWSVVGNVADGTADSGAAVKIGSRIQTGALAAGTNNNRADTVSDKFRRMLISDAPQVGTLVQNVTVGTSAALLVGSNFSGRMHIIIQNLGAKPIYIGSSSGVTSSNGLKIPTNSVMDLDIGDQVSLYAISGTAGQDVRVLEIG